MVKKRTSQRLRALWLRLGAWMPMVLLALVAAFSWWVAQVVMQAEHDARQELRGPTLPDYVLHTFTTERYDAQGRLTMSIAGNRMVHDPKDNVFTIADPQLRATAADGSVTTATAQKGRSNADASNVQLIGDAVVRRAATASQPALTVRSTFLNVFPNTQVVQSDQPTVIDRGGSRFSGDSLNFNGIDGTVDMGGKVRGTLAPQASAPAR